MATAADSVDDRRTRLVDDRDRIEKLMLTETDGAKYAALSREYRQVLAEIATMAPAAKGSKVDELAARRQAAAGDPGATDSAPASRRAQSRRRG